MQDSGHLSLFGHLPRCPNVFVFTLKMMFLIFAGTTACYEKELLDVYFSGHPLAAYTTAFDRITL